MRTTHADGSRRLVKLEVHRREPPFALRAGMAVSGLRLHGLTLHLDRSPPRERVHASASSKTRASAGGGVLSASWRRACPTGHDTSCPKPRLASENVMTG